MAAAVAAGSFGPSFGLPAGGRTNATGNAENR